MSRQRNRVLSIQGIAMLKIAVCCLGVATVALANGHSAKEDFLGDYRQLAEATERRLTKNVQLTIHGESLDETGKVIGVSETTYRTNDRCMLVKEVINPGNHLNFYLLRPEGIYRIFPSSAKPGEYLLRQFQFGSFSASQAGPPYFGPVFPLIRVTLSLQDHLASDRVNIIDDQSNGVTRDLKVTERIGASVCTTTYRFRLQDMMLDEYFGMDQESVPYRFKFHYTTIDGQSYPSRLERFIGKPGGALRLAGTAEFGSYQQVWLSDSEFSLHQFGLPDPVGIHSNRRAPIHIWLLVAGLVCIAMVWLMRRITRLRRYRESAV